MNPERAANDLLTEFDVLKLPINPFNLCATLDVEVAPLDLGETCDGFLLVQNYKARIGINSNIKSEKRRTFTIAHELGHLCLDVAGVSDKKIECEATGIDSFSRGLPEIEVRANRFASELLLPKGIVTDLVLNRGLSWNSIDEIAELASVSRTATARKFAQLTDEACAFVVSEKGVIKWFVSSSTFELKIDMAARILHPGGPADSATKGISFPNEFVEVPASSWVQSSASIKEANLQEWSLPLNQYGQVLTLVWDDIGIGELDEDELESEGDEGKFDPKYGWETPTFGRKRR
jgi:Zn-dependent peptidase ImmA (M78 family)